MSARAAGRPSRTGRHDGPKAVTSTLMQPLATIPSPAEGVWHLGPFPLRAYALMIILGIVAAVWLGENYQQYTADTAPSFRDEHQWNSLAEVDLPDNFVSVGDGEPFFRITTKEAGPGYREIHTVVVEGEPVCRVSVMDIAPVS